MRILLTLILIGICFQSKAQDGLFRAYLKASEDYDPIENIRVLDATSGKWALSDASGFVEIKTKVGNTIEFSGMGVKTQKIVVKQQMFVAIQQIVIKIITQELPEFTVRGQTPYQIDSVERLERYKIPLSHQKDKAEVIITPFGLAVDNPVSSWMQYVAPKTKQKLKFQKNFSKWEEEKYINSKYKEDHVAQLTGLKNDTLAWFINSFPMPYIMARTATDKEIDFWIKGNYEDWKSNVDSFIQKVNIKND